MTSRFTPAARAGAAERDRDDESTFERIRHIRFENKRNPKRRRILERIQHANAQDRRTI